jgi:hypothetical protein
MSAPAFIDAVPDDILVAVFLIAQDENPPSTYPSSYDQEELPVELLVTKVCRRWRSLAIGLSCLWSRLTLSDSPDASALLNRALLYLNRSDTAPLVVRLELPIEHSSKFGRALDLLLSKAQYWSRVSIQFPGQEGSLVDIFHALHHVRAPWLEYLSMISTKAVYPPPNNTTADSEDVHLPTLFASGYPNLRLLRISGRATGFCGFQLGTITTLHLEQCCGGRVFTLARLREILSQCSELVNLSIEGTLLSPASWSMSAPPKIDLPRLQSLRVCGITGEVYSGMLVALSAPCLESLLLKKVMLTDLDIFLDACVISPPGFPHLKSIVLDDFEFRVPTYHRWFSTFPDICHITVIDTPTKIPTIIRLLSRELNEENCSLPPDFLACPKLETLTLLLHYDDPEVLVDAAKARCVSGHPLRKIRLGVTSDLEDWEKEELKESLEEYVKEVELFHEADPWPNGLPYTDEDDTWYED